MYKILRQQWKRYFVPKTPQLLYMEQTSTEQTSPKILTHCVTPRPFT